MAADSRSRSLTIDGLIAELPALGQDFRGRAAGGDARGLQ